ncbi:MAG: hypothetical protein LBQ11_02590 [Candidatus Nomurabacteria bacterium]|jgi:hypothetical protein|nr:hypothetical protein [Candidatus Nomurabacteria bacterium]
MNFPLIIMIVAAVAMGVILVVIITLTRGKNGLLDQKEYRVRWLEIENGLEIKNVANYQFAVLAADKLLDQALRDLDLEGDTIDDRLKNAKNKFSNLNTVRAARKIRNRIAHEADVNLDLTSTKQALAAFKKALKELGAI